MTREDAINRVQRYLTDYLPFEDLEELEEIIKALEQESMLDKIRAEIADLDDTDYDFEGYYKAVTDALQIIDKYKAERERAE